MGRRGMARRSFIGLSTVAAGCLVRGTRPARPALAQGAGPALITPDKSRPPVPYGVMTGDVTAGRAIVRTGPTSEPERG